MHIVIITGMSGSGKTLALNTLEDQGYYCIDNLPPELLLQLFQTSIKQQHEKLAVCIDIRSGKDKIAIVPKLLADIRNQYANTHILYLFSTKGILKKRYSETRRKHPLCTGNVSMDEAIEEETQLLDPISQIADFRLDTTRLGIYELAQQIRERFCKTDLQSMSLMFQSFGFKHFAPTDSDYLFDVRCLPNPYWVHELREHTGKDQIIQDWLQQHQAVDDMFQSIRDFMKQWLPRFEQNQKPYMTVSIGCTGGKHRSVYIAEQLAKHFRQQYPNTLLHHRELAKLEK